jgi:hypothetical protein
MPLDIPEATRRALAELHAGDSGRTMTQWRQENGIIKSSVRIDVPLDNSSVVLHKLRWLANEIPRLCARIEREADEEDRLIVASQGLQTVRHRFGARRKRV